MFVNTKIYTIYLKFMENYEYLFNLISRVLERFLEISDAA